MSAPYSISLLNDLHNYFPDLLYQPQRFQSVPDVLNYVVSVANQNPYERARNAYQSARTAPVPASASASAPAPAPVSASAPATSSIRNNRSIEESSAEYYQIIHGARLPETEMVFTSSRPSRSSSSRAFLGSNWLGGNSTTDTILTSLIGQMIDVPSLQNFLDQPVTVHPTAEQIRHYTTLTTAPRNMDDNCAICQDPIEQGQNVRILNYCTHSFHTNCIDTWFATHVTCPTCRHDIRNNS
jgi:E3 ubiquitin-protein ligase ATL6/9/15/31/42/55